MDDLTALSLLEDRPCSGLNAAGTANTLTRFGFALDDITETLEQKERIRGISRGKYSLLPRPVTGVGLMDKAAWTGGMNSERETGPCQVLTAKEVLLGGLSLL